MSADDDEDELRVGVGEAARALLALDVAMRRAAAAAFIRLLVARSVLPAGRGPRRGRRRERSGA